MFYPPFFSCFIEKFSSVGDRPHFTTITILFLGS
jgi:hypothetical protein